MKVCCEFSLESPHRGGSTEYTQHTIFNIKKNHPILSHIISYGIFFQGIQERVRNSRGKRAISVRATEGLLYYQYAFSQNRHDSSSYVSKNAIGYTSKDIISANFILPLI